MDSRQFTYRIDGNDCINYVSKEWVDFAQENGAPELTESNVIGKSLWGFISDSDTRQIYQELLKKTRAHNTDQKIEFSCDTPGIARLMQIRMTPVGNDLIEFACVTVEEKYRTPIILLNGKSGTGTELVKMCSWCKKIYLSGKWWELDEAINLSAAFSVSPPPSITHGICGGCKTKLLPSESDSTQ